VQSNGFITEDIGGRISICDTFKRKQTSKINRSRQTVPYITQCYTIKKSK